MSFVETHLDLGIDYGTRASLRFNTTVLVAGDGAEQRNANWSQPLGKWLLGDRTVSNTELDYFLDFHAARIGSYEGFRFKDWTDYQGIGQLIGTGDGNKTQFQLIKTYTVGSNSVKRPILKPIANTVKIYSNGIQLNSGWSVDVVAGVVTFTTAPNNGVAITADFEFDVPVRFEQDKIDFRFDAYEVGTRNAIFQLQNLSLIELRLKPNINISPSQLPASINEVLDLGYDYGTVGGPAYNTTITNVGAGYEKRTSNWDESRGRWQIGDRTVTRAELDYLIAFYRVTRGSATGFLYQDWQTNQNKQVRFETDSIEFRFDAIDLINNEAIFYLSGLPVVELINTQNVTFNSLTVTSGPFGTQLCRLRQLEQRYSQAFDGRVLATYSFTVNPPPEVQDWDNVRCYLKTGYWDDCGSIGSYSNQCVGGQVQRYSGPDLLISTGSASISGTVRNTEIPNCSVDLYLLWIGSN